MWLELLVVCTVILVVLNGVVCWARSRGDEVGQIRVRAHQFLGPREATLMVRRARRGEARIILLTRISAGTYYERLEPREALRLAAILEKAADCCPGS